MVNITAGEFKGLACLWLDNGQVRLAVTTDRGPRIVFWSWSKEGSANFFAELPDVTDETPGGTYYFLGGHRLWYAPEIHDRTYWPDNAPLEVTMIENGVTLIAPPDGPGIVKGMSITVAPDSAAVTVRHILRNAGVWPVDLAPWGLSMCRLGGTAIFPQPRSKTDPDGLLPNRRFSFWTYSNPADPRLLIGNRVVLVQVTEGPHPANKFGYRNADGWAGYLLDDTLFTTHWDPHLEAEHPDYGSNTEGFFNHLFIEIETLGPLVSLAPGATITHDETWKLHSATEKVSTEDEALALIERLGL